MGNGVTLFLAGDVMTGRGVDQILPAAGESTLREQTAKDARTYVSLAESAGGPISRPVDFSWPWGEALAVLDRAAPDVRLVNLEASVTVSDDYAAGKAIHYRMAPGNVPCLTAARLDVCVLANNHVLDFGVRGLVETLEVLGAAGLRTVGAGLDGSTAWSPAMLDVGRGRRVLVWSVAARSSGVPDGWAAAGTRPGVALLPEVSEGSATELAGRIRPVTRPDDLVVVSVHWGSNWGYEVPESHVEFAHRLIDEGVHVVHGHSSHHPRPFEVYRDGLVLYGCGDLIDDYEGIGGYEQYRPDLRLLYLPTVDPGAGGLLRLRLVPMQLRQMRLCQPSPADVHWLRALLSEINRPFDTRIDLAADGTLTLTRG
ncbi:MAG TPA: CapA family protein [Micromonosporaceae bacterium]|nr:CapA family protein [Micromonosporaceae bacterium]